MGMVSPNALSFSVMLNYEIPCTAFSFASTNSLFFGPITLGVIGVLVVGSFVEFTGVSLQFLTQALEFNQTASLCFLVCVLALSACTVKICIVSFVGFAGVFPCVPLKC